MKYIIFLSMVGFITILFISGLGFRIFRSKTKNAEEVRCRKGITG